MVEVKVWSNGSLSTRDVDASGFGDRVLARTLKEAVVMYEANARQGNAKTKTRGEVRGPNKKLWKQKHTGRARMGTKKAVHWRGGGVAFGPEPRDYSYQMPRKARRLALRNALFTKFRDGEAFMVESWPEGVSTKRAAAVLEVLGISGGALVVTADMNSDLVLSLRNVPYVDVHPASDINAHHVLLRRNIVLTPAALGAIEQRLQAAPSAANT